MVSGANRGIGRAIAETLYRAGYTLSLSARDPASLSLRPPSRFLMFGVELGASQVWGLGVKNGEINALIARVETGETLDREKTLEVLRQFLRANRSLIKAREAGFVPSSQKGKGAKPS